MPFSFRQVFRRPRGTRRIPQTFTSHVFRVIKMQVAGAWVPVVELETLTNQEMTNLVNYVGIAASLVVSPGKLSLPKIRKILFMRVITPRGGKGSWEDVAGVSAKTQTEMNFFFSALQASVDMHNQAVRNGATGVAIEVALVAPGSNLVAQGVKIGRGLKTGHCGCPRTDAVIKGA